MSILKSVLLVDDAAATREIFRIVMRHYKLDLTVLDNAEAAYEYLLAHSPDMAVLDIFLPGTDGPQLLAHIRRDGLALHTRFVATTAYHTDDTPNDVQDWGFDGYLPKPLFPSAIVPTLERLLLDQLGLPQPIIILKPC